MIDLHAHTTISDGTLTPSELVLKAHEIGLTAIAITDHDSIDGHKEAEFTANKVGITLVKGIEFSVEFCKDRLIHILGLGIDSSNSGFLNIYQPYREIRSQKLDHVFETLTNMGLKMSREQVEEFVDSNLLDRQCIAKYMVYKGFTSIIKESWVKYLDKIPYIKGELISPEDAFNAIHNGGGKAFMAHYHLNIGLKGYNDKEIDEKLTQLKELGLDGLEYYYPSFTKKEAEKCDYYINKFSFLKSGGTDFHGQNRPAIKLGVGKGNFLVPDELLKNIL